MDARRMNVYSLIFSLIVTAPWSLPAASSMPEAPAADSSTPASSTPASSSAVSATDLSSEAGSLPPADERAVRPETREDALPSRSAFVPDPQALAARLHDLSDALGVPYDLLLRGREGIEALSARRYGPAEEIFRDLTERYPESAVGPFGLVLLAQSEMGENRDFSKEAAYLEALELADTRARQALRRGEAKAFNHFMRGCVLGINAIYLYRKDQVMGALRDGWRGLGALEKAGALEPSFVDPQLGLGIYDYWRSVLTQRYKYLPGFPDKREEGLRKMYRAAHEGVFTPGLARLSLIYTFMEDRRSADALPIAEELRAAYPRNVLNLEVLGRLYERGGRKKDARACYLEILAIAPESYMPYYLLGNLEYRRGGNLKKAREYYQQYIAVQSGTVYQTNAHVRLGDVYWLLGDKEEAMREWRTALRENPEHRLAKRRVEVGSRPRARAKRRPRRRTAREVSTP